MPCARGGTDHNRHTCMYVSQTKSGLNPTYQTRSKLWWRQAWLYFKLKIMTPQIKLKAPHSPLTPPSIIICCSWAWRTNNNSNRGSVAAVDMNPRMHEEKLLSFSWHAEIIRDLQILHACTRDPRVWLLPAQEATKRPSLQVKLEWT